MRRHWKEYACVPFFELYTIQRFVVHVSSVRSRSRICMYVRFGAQLPYFLGLTFTCSFWPENPHMYVQATCAYFVSISHSHSLSLHQPYRTSVTEIQIHLVSLQFKSIFFSIFNYKGDVFTIHSCYPQLK